MNISLVIFLTLFAALISSLAQLVFKKALGNRLEKKRDTLKLIRNRRIVAGVGIYFVALVVYLYALSAAPLSVVYPTFASTFIFIALISHFWLNEKLPAKRIAGVLLIFLGIVIVASTFG